MKRWLKWLGPLALLVALSLIVGANLRQGERLFRFRWSVESQVPIEVEWQPAARRDVAHTIEALGEIDAETEVEISSQVVARILKLPFREGQRVKRGELVVQLDSADFLASVRAAEARVERLKATRQVLEAELTKARRDLQRNEKLVESRTVTEERIADLQTLLDQSLARLQQNQAELVEVEASLAKTREDLADTTISSPIDGVISRLNAEEGEVVVMGTISTPGSVVMSISDPASMFLRAWVDETDAPRIKPGQQATIFLPYDNDRALRGTVRRLAPKGTNPNRQLASQPGSTPTVATFEAWIDIDAPPEELRLGMTATVEIQVDQRSACLAVPVQAVLHRRAEELPKSVLAQYEQLRPPDGRRQSILQQFFPVVLVQQNGRAHFRAVRTGVTDDEFVEVLAGVAEGDQIITGPYRVFDQLADGRSVKRAVEVVRRPRRARTYYPGEMND